MKRYQFRLQRVQKLRERVREERRLAVAEALHHQNVVESRIAQLEKLIAAEKAALREALGERVVSVDRAIRSRTYEDVLIRFDQRLHQQLGQLEQLVAARRQRQLEAERDVQVLEKLDEKSRQRYDAEYERSEQQLMDELAGLGLSRQKQLPESRP